ncbi:MAG: hypothetical protein FWC19_00945 [Treponema sp.]|nr:hypothetical protein [Treponema sp.]MCL2271359.1 hypothetical protein [Treponema sp.]
MKNCFSRLFLFFLFFCFMPLYALEINGGHRGGITAFAKTMDKFISAGDDGFILIWDIDGKTEPQRFQLTTCRIEAIIPHPLNKEICIIESGSPGDYRISAWNYEQKQKLFSVFSSEPFSFINYSGSGNFIITSGFEESKLTLFNSRTGEKINSVGNPAENHALFAATGRAERNMLLYQSSGEIYYIDIQSNSVTSNIRAPEELSNLVIFSNNRYLAGTNSKGLHLFDAVTGETLDVIENTERNTLLCSSGEEFYALAGNFTLNRFSVGRNNSLVKQQELKLSFNANHFQTRITEFAAGQENIALITENNDICIIPLDYSLLVNGKPVIIKKKNEYTHLTPVLHDNKEKFILWQQVNSRITPQIVHIKDNDIDSLALNIITGRFPLRSISSKNHSLLVLDTAGNLSVYNLLDLKARPDFAFISAGTSDAAFINDENIILCRNSVNNNSLFLSVNLKTTETLPLHYNAQAALTLYSGKTGKIYAETVELENNRFKTTVIDLSSASPSMIYEYPAEAINLSIAESSGRLAIACGSEGAFIFPDRPVLESKAVNFERTAGLPVKLAGCDNYFLNMDSEGNIAWHDNKSGKILAVFSVRGENWILKHGENYSGGIIRF